MLTVTLDDCTGSSDWDVIGDQRSFFWFIALLYGCLRVYCFWQWTSNIVVTLYSAPSFWIFVFVFSLALQRLLLLGWGETQTLMTYLTVPPPRLWLCTFTLSVAVCAVLLLPISILSNEVLLTFPHSYYMEWLNGSLIHGMSHCFCSSVPLKIIKNSRASQCYRISNNIHINTRLACGPADN